MKTLRVLAARKARRKMIHKRATAAHLPYVTAEEIEDGLAALWKLRFELDLKEELVDNAIAHLQLARGGRKR